MTARPIAFAVATGAPLVWTQEPRCAARRGGKSLHPGDTTRARDLPVLPLPAAALGTPSRLPQRSAMDAAHTPDNLEHAT